MSSNRTVVLAGASGFIGRYFRRRFEQDGWAVRTIGRKGAKSSPSATWDDDDAGLARVLDGTELLVNLAGRSVSCRYNARNKAAILESRVSTTAALGRAVALCQLPPSTWLSASTGTIYRNATDGPQTERDGALGTGFSVDVARAWEAALEAAVTPGTRKVPLRIAIVLGPGGGALRPFATLARLGLGGRMGSGTQKFSWIHVEDLYRTVLFVHARKDITGPINVAGCGGQPRTDAYGPACLACQVRGSHAGLAAAAGRHTDPDRNRTGPEKPLGPAAKAVGLRFRL
jgi:uncharacterized protein